MNEGSPEPRAQTNWRAVATFYALACAWSWPFFWWRDMHGVSWQALHVPEPLKNSLIMWGPGLAALLCFAFFRKSHQRTITFAGGAIWRSLAFYFVPMLALALAGLPLGNDSQVSHGLVGLIAVIGLFNVLGEELGWRGFLQDALRPLPHSPRYALIAVLWLVWHFTNNFAGMNTTDLLARLVWYLPLTIVLSVLIGESTDRSRAVLIAVTLHSWIDLCFEFPGARTYLVAVLSVPFWAWLLWRWPNKTDTLFEGESLGYKSRRKPLRSPPGTRDCTNPAAVPRPRPAPATQDR